MFCFARSKGVNVHVYKMNGDCFERITCFDVANASHTIHMLHLGGSHYDSLELQERNVL